MQFHLEFSVRHLRRSCVASAETVTAQAKVIARALKCHPAVLVFPGWGLGENTAA